MNFFIDPNMKPMTINQFLSALAAAILAILVLLYVEGRWWINEWILDHAPRWLILLWMN